MDSYVSRDETRRKPGQLFGVSDEARILRAISAKANAMRRMSGAKSQKRTFRFQQDRAKINVA